MAELDAANIDFNLLHTFHTFASSGSLAATARHLHRSQPAISIRLHQLEEQLGIKLLHRVGRRLQLTDAGRTVADNATEVSGSLTKLLDSVRLHAGVPRGRLRVGALPTVSSYLLAPAVATFIADPNIRLHMEHDLSGPLCERLRGGLLDVVVSIGDPPSGRLDVTQLGIVRPALAARCDQIRGRSIGIRRLRTLDQIAYTRVDDPFFESVDQFIKRADLASLVRLRVPHIQSIKQLVLAGAGVSILPDYTIIESDLNPVRIAGFSPGFPLWMAARSGTLEIPLVDRFWSLVRST